MPAPIRPQPSTPTVLISGTCCPPGWCSSDALDERGDPLSSADAGRGNAPARVPPAHFEQQREQQARAGHPQRMAQRDGAAVDVHPIAIEPEILFDREILRRKRLVDLE